MKLSIYLLRDTVKDFDEIVQDKYLAGDGAFRALDQTNNLPFECKAYIQRNKAKSPRWVKFLSSHFRAADLALTNQSNSFLLLLHVSDRFFAVTFGYGFQAIDRSKVEPRFGLMAVANSLDPDRIRTVDANNIDMISRQTRTHISMGSNVDEFDLNFQVDLVRKLGGKPISAALAKFASGADSICIGVDCALDRVGDKCAELLKAFRSDAYKVAFGYLDHLWPINRKAPEIAGLEAKLEAKIAARSHNRLAVALPEIPDEEVLDFYKIFTQGRAVELDELDLEGIYAFLAGLRDPPSIRDVSIIGIGDNYEPVTPKRTLRDYLVCELDADGETYIFCLGEWYRADRNFVKDIREQVETIPDRTSSLGLIPIRNKEPEAAYNERVASVKEWVGLDKNNFRVGGKHDKVEVCDLLTDAPELICVKKMDKSSTLSHLFAQGSVSAALLRRHDGYLKRVNEIGAAHWPADWKPLTGASLNTVTFIYAIASRRGGSLAETMFFFSQVNLLFHVKMIRQTGCDVALCKIEYEEPAVAPKKARRQKEATLPPRALGSDGTTEVDLPA